MFFRILKKELSHKRGINFILFIFMFLATIFVASSVNNIIVISNATNYCLDKGKVGDIYVSAFEKDGEKNLGDWLKSSKSVKSFTKDKAIMLSIANISTFRGIKGYKFQTSSSIFLQSQWKKHMLVFDMNGNKIHLKNGEIAISRSQMDLNHLKVGDEITLKWKDLKKTFKIKYETLDPAFGGDYVGITRFLVSDKDFQDFENENADLFYNYNIMTNQVKACEQQINQQALPIITMIDQDMLSFAYIMTMISAVILIIVGVCLILIAFLILRFTIVFTLQEDFKEIGIMKAIGIRHSTMRQIYLTKYFFLVSIAAACGMICSIPVSNLMIASVKKSMLMQNASVHFFVNIICSILVACIVLGMCYLCTNKLKKFTVIEAIRSGQQGERFRQKTILYLKRRKRMPVVIYLAWNDILASVRRYVVLILTFMIGTLLIILPLNTITSLKSDEMVKNFAMDRKADFYINGFTQNKDAGSTFDTEYIKQTMHDIKDSFAKKGYIIDTNILTYYSFSMYLTSSKNSFSVMTSHPVGSNGSYYDITQGYLPKEQNEIALSENQAKRMHAKVGDSIHVKIGDQNNTFIITGLYQNFVHLGESALLNAKIDLKGVKMSNYWAYQCYVKNVKFNSETYRTLKKDFPQYKIYNKTQLMNTQLGSTGSQMQSLKILIVSLVLGINILITILMTKLFILSEKNQIAILMCMGFSQKCIMLWQILRMATILCVSVFLGACVSIPLNDVTLKPIFSLMGATHMVIQVDPFEVYFKYPCLLLLVICIATSIATGSIRRISLMEINHED